jgi:hypothetical protein
MDCEPKGATMSELDQYLYQVLCGICLRIRGKCLYIRGTAKIVLGHAIIAYARFCLKHGLYKGS